MEKSLNFPVTIPEIDFKAKFLKKISLKNHIVRKIFQKKRLQNEIFEN